MARETEAAAFRLSFFCFPAAAAERPEAASERPFRLPKAASAQRPPLEKAMRCADFQAIPFLVERPLTRNISITDNNRQQLTLVRWYYMGSVYTSAGLLVKPIKSRMLEEEKEAWRKGCRKLSYWAAESRE
ncbi:hypothetical protein ACTHPH_04005 [Paenibacillus pasadenensis]